MFYVFVSEKVQKKKRACVEKVFDFENNIWLLMLYTVQTSCLYYVFERRSWKRMDTDQT